MFASQLLQTQANPTTSMSDIYNKMCETLEATKVDVDRAEEGNKAATSRVRKAMQELKALAQDLRKETLELPDSGAKQG